MKREEELVNKLNRLLRRLRAPKYLNKVGPKKYTMAEKLYALFLRCDWKSSFRRTVKLCNNVGVRCPSKSTLHYLLSRIPWQFIKNMLRTTVDRQVKLAAIDGTTLSRRNFGWHYMIRSNLDVKKRKNSKLSIMIDTRSKQILAARFRKKNTTDIMDAAYLIKNTAIKPTKIVADKGYDAEHLYKLLANQGIKYCIATRKNSKKGFYRKKNITDQRTYRRRPMIESTFFTLKQHYGRNINCLKANTMRKETFIRLILHNIEETITLI